MKPTVDTFVPGDWNAICDRCGRQFKASLLRATYDGLRVCKADWEPRQPQEFVRPTGERITAPWQSPEPIPDVCLTGTAICTYAIAGCAIAGRPFY